MSVATSGTRLREPAYRCAHAGYSILANSEHSGNVIAPTTNAIWLVEEVTPVAQRGFSVLVDRDRNRLHVSVAPPFPRRPDPNLRQGFIQGGLSALRSYHLSGPDIAGPY